MSWQDGQSPGSLLDTLDEWGCVCSKLQCHGLPWDTPVSPARPGGNSDALQATKPLLMIKVNCCKLSKSVFCCRLINSVSCRS